MSYKPLDDRQVVNRAALPNIGTPANTTLDVILADIDSEIGGGGANFDLILTSSVTGEVLVSSVTGNVLTA